jgi:flagellar biosynthesis component FlhA
MFRTFAGMSVKALVHQNAINAAAALIVALGVWRLGFRPELPAVVAFMFRVLVAVIAWKMQRLPVVLFHA